MNYTSPLQRGNLKPLAAFLLLTVCAVVVALCMPARAYADGTLVYVVGQDAKVHVDKSKSSRGVAVRPGQTLMVKERSYSEWYTVISGPSNLPNPGYIYKRDVETSLKGSSKITIGTPVAKVNLYEYPSYDAPVAETIGQGTLIQWANYNVDWAWAIKNGKTIFFKTDNMALYTARDSQVIKAAIMEGTQNCRVAPSSSAAVNFSRPEGRIIQFIDYDDNYYVAKTETDQYTFIPKSNLRIYAPKITGVLNREVKSGGANVYAGPSKRSTVVKRLQAGEQVTVADFDGEWYAATMTVNGKDTSVYFYAKDFQEPSMLCLIAARESSSVYDAPNGSVLQQVRKGTIVRGMGVGNGWYQVQLYRDGVYSNVYITKDDFRPMINGIKMVETYTDYNITFRNYVSNQLLNGPMNKYFNSSGSYVTAPDNFVAWYMDPKNFPFGTTSHLQFLRLDKPVGASNDALNKQLEGMGVLSGQGRAFSYAAYKYKVNELYLMSHAIHETGKGTSNLSKGVYYDPVNEDTTYYPREGAVKVYNVYGIGATDNNALNGGAKKAYLEGWTSVEKAIIGGAEFVARSYIAPRKVTLSGQNTLYKMLWHPEYNAKYDDLPWHQYATDIAWADKQTYNLGKYYADFNAYTLTFDVPRFR